MDGIIVSSKEDAPELIFPEQAQGRAVGCFITSMKTLGSYLEDASDSQNNLDFITGNQIQSHLLSMVAIGRIDIAIDDNNVVLYTIEKEQLQQ